MANRCTTFGESTVLIKEYTRKVTKNDNTETESPKGKELLSTLFIDIKVPKITKETIEVVNLMVTAILPSATGGMDVHYHELTRENTHCPVLPMALVESPSIIYLINERRLTE